MKNKAKVIKKAHINGHIQNMSRTYQAKLSEKKRVRLEEEQFREEVSRFTAEKTERRITKEDVIRELFGE